MIPNGVYGTLKYIHSLYLDMMAIIGRYGKPDYFITFTANPHWREIEDNLEKHQQSHERMDLVCRVFSLKVKDLMK